MTEMEVEDEQELGKLWHTSLKPTKHSENDSIQDKGAISKKRRSKADRRCIGVTVGDEKSKTEVGNTAMM